MRDPNLKNAASKVFGSHTGLLLPTEPSSFTETSIVVARAFEVAFGQGHEISAIAFRIMLRRRNREAISPTHITGPSTSAIWRSPGRPAWIAAMIALLTVS